MGRLRASANRGVSSISLIHPEAIYDIDFANGQWFGALPSDLVVSRASEALTLTAGGTYANFASNTARITGNGLMIEEARTNLSRNSSGDGFATGVGAAVPHWTFSTAALSHEIVGQETRNGIRGLLVRFAGTPSATSGQSIVFADANTANIGETYTNSLFVQIAAGSLGTANTFQVRAFGEASGTSFTPDATFQHIRDTRTLTATDERCTLRWNYSNTTTAVDFTLFIGGAQSSLAGFSLSPITTVANAATRPADVVYLPISGIGTEYTVYTETAAPPSGTVAAIEAWTSSTDRLSIRNSSASSFASILTGNVTQTAPTGVIVGANRKTALRVQTGSFQLSANGVVGGASAASAPASSPGRLYIGSANAGGTALYNANIRRIAIIPRALTDAELQTLTT